MKKVMRLGIATVLLAKRSEKVELKMQKRAMGIGDETVSYGFVMGRVLRIRTSAESRLMMNLVRSIAVVSGFSSTGNGIRDSRGVLHRLSRN